MDHNHQADCGCRSCKERNRSARQRTATEKEQFLGSFWPFKSDCQIEDRTHLTPKSKRIRQRDPKSVYALVLHQMAFSRGSNPDKYNKVTAHYAILPDGKILQLHPVSAYLYASNGFNAKSVAVEFAGNFPNTRGKCWHKDKFGCHQLTQAQIEAGRCLVRQLIQQIGLTHVLAHRQSSGTRENDPGPDLWYQVGQWAVDNLGLKDGGPGFKIGSGKPIPELWRTWGSVKTQPELLEAIDPESPAHTRWLQQALNQTLGLRLPENGIAGPETHSALRGFQARHGIPADGELSEELEELLIAEGASHHLHLTGTDQPKALAMPDHDESEAESFLSDWWHWITGDSNQQITYARTPGQDYGPKFTTLPGGLPEWARKTSVRDAAAPHVERLAKTHGLSALFVKTVVQMARTESGAQFARPANNFDARPPSERPSGKGIITAWGVFQFNRDAWTYLIPQGERSRRRSWIAKGERGCSITGGCVLPWDTTAYEEIDLPIKRYANLFIEVRSAGGSDLDAARGLRLWHISPAAYKSWLNRGKSASFDAAWSQVSAKLRERITKFLTQAGVV